MTDSRGLLTDPKKFILGTLTEAGAPLTTLHYEGPVAMRVGDEIGIGVVIGNRDGVYSSLDEARRNMRTGDRLYTLRARRVE